MSGVFDNTASHMSNPDVNSGLTPETEGEEGREELGGLGEVIRGIRARLQPGGPEVDYPSLYAYVSGVLIEDERRLVREKIAVWLRWHDAYWEIRAAVEGGAEPDRPAD